MPAKASQTTDVDDAQLVAWRDRLQTLERCLDQAAQSEWRWVWNVRRRIVEYLLRRYGREQVENAGIDLPVDGDSQVADYNDVSPEPYRSRRLASAKQLQRDEHASLRDAQSIRRTLQHTEEANRERYDEWEQDTQRLLEEHAAIIAEFRRRAGPVCIASPDWPGRNPKPIHPTALSRIPQVLALSVTAGIVLWRCTVAYVMDSLSPASWWFVAASIVLIGLIVTRIRIQSMPGTTIRGPIRPVTPREFGYHVVLAMVNYTASFCIAVLTVSDLVRIE